MNLFPKFIVEDGNLIMGKVEIHRNLVTDDAKVSGGGFFNYDYNNRSFIFSGYSFEYGKAMYDDIRECVLNNKVFSNKYLTHNISKDYTFYYNTGTEIVKIG